jgi:hypothetical protein
MIDTLLEGFTIRPPTMGDVKTTVALMRLYDPTEYGDSDANESNQAAVWRETGEVLTSFVSPCFNSVPTRYILTLYPRS